MDTPSLRHPKWPTRLSVWCRFRTVGTTIPFADFERASRHNGPMYSSRTPTPHPQECVYFHTMALCTAAARPRPVPRNVCISTQWPYVQQGTVPTTPPSNRGGGHSERFWARVLRRTYADRTRTLGGMDLDLFVAGATAPMSPQCP